MQTAAGPQAETFTQLGAWAQTQLWHNESCCSNKHKQGLIASNNTLFSRCQWKWHLTAVRGVLHQHACAGQTCEAPCSLGWQQTLWEGNLQFSFCVFIKSFYSIYCTIFVCLYVCFKRSIEVALSMWSPMLAPIFSMPFSLQIHIWIQCMS